MLMSRWVYILLGDDNTGKTTFQKQVLKHLCNENRDTKLYTNLRFPVQHVNAPSHFESASFGSRSYQEKSMEYGSILNYFAEYFKPADVCLIASHLVVQDVQEMIDECHKRQFNVGAIFWSNSIESSPTENESIALLAWDERFRVDNPIQEDVEVQKQQIDYWARRFTEMVVSRAAIQ
ncbi:hypothetical protein JZ785_27035 [Alicyclobacillus curvatus]|nr:hypothetical protein JZ785_27035 [Alicyclobacillus curvatus]